MNFSLKEFLSDNETTHHKYAKLSDIYINTTVTYI